MEIKVVFQELDCVTKSNRFYPKSVFKKAIRKFKKEFVVEDKAMGECHIGKTGNEIYDNININLDNVSHHVIEIKTKGNKVVGKIKILDTIRGIEFKNLLDGGYNDYYIALRGIGTLEKNEDGVNVVTELTIISFDIYKEQYDIGTEDVDPD